MNSLLRLGIQNLDVGTYTDSITMRIRFALYHSSYIVNTELSRWSMKDIDNISVVEALIPFNITINNN